MEKGKIAEAAVRLRIATRKASITQSQGRRKGTLSLDAKILFLIREKPLTPNTIIDLLELQKSNLASIANGLEKRGFMERHKLFSRRETAYHITDAGREYIETKLEEIEKSFASFIDDEKEYESAVETLESATRLLSFVENRTQKGNI